MGNTLSSWGGQKQVASIINKAGLPLKIAEGGSEGDSRKPLSPFTEAYNAAGWFTGVRSRVTVPAKADAVYASLSKDLQNLFTPMSECDDEILEQSDDGRQSVYRVVRIPFAVAFVTGNLKLRLNVEQNPNSRKVHFESAREGRLITKFLADFHISPKEGEEGHTVVELNAKVDCKSLPPPPFRNMVKEVMVSKMDSCMVDLVDFHSRPATASGAVDVEANATEQPPLGSRASEQLSRKGSREIQGSARKASQGLDRKASQGFLASLRRSFSRGLPASRRSFERRRSLEKQRQAHSSLERVRVSKSETRKHASLPQAPVPHAHLPPLISREDRTQTASSGGQVSVFAGWQGGLDK